MTHQNLTSNLHVLSSLNLIHKDDRFLVPLPFHHVYPFTIGLLASLAAKIPLILPHSLTGPQLLRALPEGRPSVMLGIPRLYEALFRLLKKSRPTGITRYRLGPSVFLRRRLGIRLGRVMFSTLHREMVPLLRRLVSIGSALSLPK